MYFPRVLVIRRKVMKMKREIKLSKRMEEKWSKKNKKSVVGFRKIKRFKGASEHNGW